MRFFSVIAGIFGAILAGIFFNACGDNGAISQATNGIIQTHIKPQIIFKQKVSDNINAVIESKGEIRINGAKYFGKYIFDSENSLTLLTDSPLNANQNYKINFDFDAINKAQGTSINAKNFTMEFSTESLHSQLEGANFIKDSADLSKMKLEARLHLSQSLPQDSIASAIKLADSAHKNIPLHITSISDREIAIASDSLPLPKSDESFALTIDKDLGLEKSEKFMILASNADFLKVIDIKPIMGDKNSIEIRFSAPLMPNLNIENFIRVSPNVDFRASQSNDTIVLSGNFSQSDYEIEILKGIKSRDGFTLKENTKHTITLGDKEPKIVFSNNGVFLPDLAKKQVAFKSINVKKARIVVQKIYANNIAYYLDDNNLMKNQTNDFYIYRIDKIGGVIFEKEITINAPKNEWIQSAVDLSKLKDLSGIFVISLHFDKDGVNYNFPSSVESWRVDNYFYDNGSIYKQLIFSNIALLAQKFGDEVIVSALDIKSNEPLPNVEISGISKNNQTISKANTDIAGNAKLKFSKNISANLSNNIAYIYGKKVGKSDDFALIKLSAQEISDDGFDTDGVSAENGIKAFIYTDRGVYRPGDSANLTIIARNKDKAINHPIKLSITNPRGKVIVNKATIESSGDGVFYYEFKSQKSAFTGIYNLQVDIGDNLFTHKIAVESVVPNRIKLDLKAQDSLDLSKEQILKFSFQSDYLFGAPASGLDWTLSASFDEFKFESKKYKDWSFERIGKDRYYNNMYLGGKLNESGFADGEFDFASFDFTKNLTMSITARVLENNGRAVIQRKRILLKNFDSFVGIKNPTNRYVRSGDSVNLNVVLLDEKENFIKNRKLEYVVYQNNYSWWWDYSNKNDFIRAIKGDKNTRIIAQGDFKSKDKISNIKFDIKDRGEILVEVVDTTNNQSASISLYASSWGEPLDIEKITQLKIKTDKNKYKHGESAKVTFESVKGAKALITISSDKEILKRYWITTNDLQTNFSVPIDDKNAPNLYASVFLLQDYGSADNDRALRLYGVVPLNITKESAKIALNIKTKDEILPNSKLNIEISNEQNKQVTYTLAIVDEGLLNLTNFKTPSPYNYFYAKTKYNIRNFDTFDYIIGKIEGAVRNAYSIGGDEELGAAGKGRNDENAERFKPVVHFIKPTKSDKNGNAKISVDVPSYIGALRVMLVAVDNNSYGSAQKEVRVSAPVVMLPTIPRSLKIGDNFQMPIEVMQIKDNVDSANLAIKSDGIVEFDKSLQEVRFKDGKKSQTIFFNGRVKEKLGVENIAIQLNSDNFIMRDSTQIDIKAPNPYTQISKNWVLKGGESALIEAPKAFVENSNSGKITLSSKPLLSIDHRLKWLIRYPYGCIEQTTSSVFPQLFITKLASENFAQKQQIVDNINAGIARIQSFQTNDGGFSYWQGGNQSDEWGSSYATHFLIMAKMNGYKVSDSVLKKAINYLKNHIDSRDIYPLYLLSLSDNHQLGAMNEIYENHLRNLSITNRWLLAASYAMAGFDDIALKISNGLSLTPNESQDYYSRSYGSNLRNKAIILQAHKIVTGNIDADLYDEIKSELEGNEWLSTQTSAYALLVLASIKDEAQKGDMGEIKGEITLNNKTQKFELAKDRVEFALNSGSAKVKSPNALFVNYSWEGITADSSNDNIAKKMQLAREFVVFDESGNERVIDAREIQSGDTFYIKILLVPHGRNRIDMDNIALSQNLPSGWEIENTRLNNDALPQAVVSANNGISYTDIRDDKIMWFFDVGESQMVYVKINAVTPGVYTLPAAYAEAMYDGSYKASTDSFKVRVVAK
ncbi:alpha-2-macroglobulin family protein [Helicobacter sp. 23-1045]